MKVSDLSSLSHKLYIVKLYIYFILHFCFCECLFLCLLSASLLKPCGAPGGDWWASEGSSSGSRWASPATHRGWLRSGALAMNMTFHQSFLD